MALDLTTARAKIVFGCKKRFVHFDGARASREVLGVNFRIE